MELLDFAGHDDGTWIGKWTQVESFSWNRTYYVIELIFITQLLSVAPT